MRAEEIRRWAESIAELDTGDTDTGKKRPRSPTAKRTHLPSPSSERSPNDHDPTMPTSPKRRRVADPTDELNATPRGRRIPSAFDGAEELHHSAEPSTPSRSATSQISRSSSPRKQLMNAELQATGFETAKFEDHTLPESLEVLVHALDQIHNANGIIPDSLQEELASQRGISTYNFGPDNSIVFEYPPLKLVYRIMEHAKKCSSHAHGESSWNLEVHARVLEWVLRDAPGSDGPLDYRYCVNASIIPEFKPKNAPAKMVDFCLAIEVEAEDDKTIKDLRRIRPEMSINHTDWGDLVRNPIAISIETKCDSDYRQALIQVATWHSAQWRSLLYGGTRLRRIEFLPGIIVLGNEWWFVASVRGDDGRSITLETLPIGGTARARDVYVLIACLQRMKLWAESVFWPAFKADVLDGD